MSWPHSSSASNSSPSKYFCDIKFSVHIRTINQLTDPFGLNFIFIIIDVGFELGVVIDDLDPQFGGRSLSGVGFRWLDGHLQQNVHDPHAFDLHHVVDEHLGVHLQLRMSFFFGNYLSLQPLQHRLWLRLQQAWLFRQLGTLTLITQIRYVAFHFKSYFRLGLLPRAVFFGFGYPQRPI